MDLSLLFFGAILLLLIVFMVRNGRKRQKDQLELSQSLKPGAEVMTTFGLFGTVESVDEEENKVVLRTGPTSELTIHRQAIGRVVAPNATVDDDEVTEDDVTLDEPVVALDESSTGERGGASAVEPAPEQGDRGSRRGAARAAEQRPEQ